MTVDMSSMTKANIIALRAVFDEILGDLKTDYLIGPGDQGDGGFLYSNNSLS
jgi:hypothetical protein